MHGYVLPRPSTAASAGKRSAQDAIALLKKVKVLSAMIKHHVKEEEQRDGMFAKARHSKMDLQALGRQLAERKSALMRELS